MLDMTRTKAASCSDAGLVILLIKHCGGDAPATSSGYGCLSEGDSASNKLHFPTVWMQTRCRCNPPDTARPFAQ